MSRPLQPALWSFLLSLRLSAAGERGRYDSLSRKRIRRESSWSTGSNNWQLNEVRKFVYNGLDVIQERDGTDRVLVSYTRAGNIGGLLSRTVRANTDENSTVADKSYFYHYDGGGNVVALTNASGQAVARYTYDAYGNLVKSGLTATDATLSDAVDQAQQNRNKYRFSTKEYHDWSGLYDYGFRFYNSGLGKWINRDPIAEAGGLNLYAFAGNNPITLVDEYGFSSTPMSVAASFGRGVRDGLLNGGMTFITSMIMAATVGTLMGSCAPAVPIITAIVCAIGGAVGVKALVEQLQAIFDSDLCPEDKAYQLGLLVGDAIAGAVGGGLGARFAPTNTMSCFVAGTLVAMADGTFKPIEDVKENDLVLSKDEKSGEVKASKVSQTYVREAGKTLVFTFSDGTKLEATEEHPFYIEDKGFVAAKHAGVGSSVVTRAGPALRVLDVQEKKKTVKVYNFEVEGTHTYFVTDSQLWVHNACGTPEEGAAAAANRNGGTNDGPPITDVNGTPFPNQYKFPNARAARQAASETAGDLGPMSAPIRLKDFRGLPNRLTPKRVGDAINIIGRQAGDGRAGWAQHALGHPRFGSPPHVNAWINGVEFHFFY